MKNAPTATLESLTDGKRKITYGVVKPGDPDPCEGIVFIRGGDISEGRINIPSLRTIRKDVSDQYKRTLLKGGELLVSLVGNPGEVASAPRKLAGANIARQVGLIDLTDDVCHKFVEWFLRSPQGQAEMGLYVTGAVQKVINLADLKRVRIPLPEIATQRKIASILSTYDDLIGNNTRRIEILEEIARRLYEEWFVHFRFPGHEEVSFKESELGEIPEGWEVQELGDVSQINPEAIKPKSAPDKIHYIDIASVSPGQIDKAETMQFANAPGRARRIVRSGDVLWSCVRPNRRSCAMIVEPRENTVASTGFAVLRTGSISKHYLYQYVRADQFVSYLVNRATGAAYPAVKAADFKEPKIVVPQKDILSDFDKAVSPMRSLIHRLDRKNANLRAQRDLLLPKLVSGEIDVSDITMPEDKEVEAA